MLQLSAKIQQTDLDSTRVSYALNLKNSTIVNCFLIQFSMYETPAKRGKNCKNFLVHTET